MLKQRKFNTKKTEKLIFYLVGGIILLFLTINSYLLFKQNKRNLNQLNSDNIKMTALLYLKSNEKERAGYFLDCSGYTRSVYKQYNVIIPYSAREQFTSCKRLAAVNLKGGNLVFFKTNRFDVSHAGIYIDSNRFIHSPGKMKYVRIDSLSNPYWKKCFVCGGKPVFNQSITLN